MFDRHKSRCGRAIRANAGDAVAVGVEVVGIVADDRDGVAAVGAVEVAALGYVLASTAT